MARMRLDNIGQAQLHLVSFSFLSQLIPLPTITPSCGVPLVTFAVLL